MRKVFLLWVIFAMATFQISYAWVAAPLDSIGTLVVAGKTCVRYMVSPGETIYRISTLYRVPISDLIEMNPELEGGLKVGQIISIPYNAKSLAAGMKEAPNTNSLAAVSNNLPVEKPQLETNADNKKVHVVQPGETLYGLSRKYNVSIDDLKKWNSFELKAGQEIMVSRPAVEAKAPESTNKINPVATNEPVVVEKNIAPTTSVTPAPQPKSEPLPVVRKAEPVKVIPSAASAIDTVTYSFDPTMEQVLIIPFDPYLYFSDADDEMAAGSNMHRTKIRQVFRRRMNALLDHPAYENIHLLGGKANDSISDLNKIYSSVTYNYQEALYNPNYVEPTVVQQQKATSNNSKSWLQKQKEKITTDESGKKAVTARDNGKYFGVLIRNPEFFNYFNRKYNTDYYVFINQFEVKTNYENCLDRAAQNFDRTFTTHFSIFNSSGKQIAGNKFKLHYNSNSNNVQQIVTENMLKIAERILAELPTPAK